MENQINSSCSNANWKHTRCHDRLGCYLFIAGPFNWQHIALVLLSFKCEDLRIAFGSKIDLPLLVLVRAWYVTLTKLNVCSLRMRMQQTVTNLQQINIIRCLWLCSRWTNKIAKVFSEVLAIKISEFCSKVHYRFGRPILWGQKNIHEECICFCTPRFANGLQKIGDFMKDLLNQVKGNQTVIA